MHISDRKIDSNKIAAIPLAVSGHLSTGDILELELIQKIIIVKNTLLFNLK